MADGALQNQRSLLPSDPRPLTGAPQLPSLRPQASNRGPSDVLVTRLLAQLTGGHLPPSDLLISSHPHQVGSDASTNKKAGIDVHRVAAVLGDLCKAADPSSNGEGEDEDRLQQLRSVRDD